MVKKQYTRRTHKLAGPTNSDAWSLLTARQFQGNLLQLQIIYELLYPQFSYESSSFPPPKDIPLVCSTSQIRIPSKQLVPCSTLILSLALHNSYKKSDMLSNHTVNLQYQEPLRPRLCQILLILPNVYLYVPSHTECTDLTLEFFYLISCHFSLLSPLITTYITQWI